MNIVNRKALKFLQKGFIILKKLRIKLWDTIFLLFGQNEVHQALAAYALGTGREYYGALSAGGDACARAGGDKQ